jgi:hypothetical protein
MLITNIPYLIYHLDFYEIALFSAINSIGKLSLIFLHLFYSLTRCYPFWICWTSSYWMMERRFAFGKVMPKEAVGGRKALVQR